MSKMSELHSDLEAIRRVMEEPGQSAEEQIERRMDFIIRELDEFCLMATNPETVDLIEGQKRLVGLTAVRARTLALLLLARHPVRHAA